MQTANFTPFELLKKLNNVEFNDAYILPNRPLQIIRGFRKETIPVVLPEEKVRELIAFLIKASGVPAGITDFAFRKRTQDYNLNFRIHLIRQGTRKDFNGLIVRKLFSYIPSPETLKVPEIVVNTFLENAREQRGGIILVTALQRQGKSTTIASLLNLYNQTEDGVIVTIENPIEYEIEPVRSIIVQKDVVTYLHEDEKLTVENLIEKASERALVDASREFPSIVYLGEIRTPFEANTAVSLAESGVFVIGTFHGETIPFALARFINLFSSGVTEREAEYRVSVFLSLLKMAVGQRLLPNAETDEKMELVSEYFIPAPSPDRIAFLNYLRKRDIVNFFQRFATASSIKGIKNLSTALREAVAEGRISEGVAVEADVYRKTLKIIGG